MIVVVNTTPFISLACIHKTEILELLFGEIIISKAVYKEIKAKKGFGYKEADARFVKVEKVKGDISKDLLLNHLDLGEAETILLAKELEADLVIIDENIAYRTAKNSGLNVTRTLSVLLKAKSMGVIQEIKPLLENMIFKGRWYSRKVYFNFLKEIGEI